jgi:hypothetical protein
MPIYSNARRNANHCLGTQDRHSITLRFLRQCTGVVLGVLLSSQNKPADPRLFKQHPGMPCRPSRFLHNNSSGDWPLQSLRKAEETWQILLPDLLRLRASLLFLRASLLLWPARMFLLAAVFLPRGTQPSTVLRPSKRNKSKETLNKEQARQQTRLGVPKALKSRMAATIR